MQLSHEPNFANIEAQKIIDRSSPQQAAVFHSLSPCARSGIATGSCLIKKGGNVMARPVAVVPHPTDEQPKIEAELRDILRRDRELLRQPGGAPAAPTSHPTELVRRVASMSTEQVERVVLQLQNLSELLQSERDRVNNEIAGYIKLNEHTLSAMQTISRALTQLSDAIPKRQA